MTKHNESIKDYRLRTQGISPPRKIDYVNCWTAGQVTRKHTMFNIRPEVIAEHTWGVVSLIMWCWPAVPAHVLYYAQHHDFGEDKTGDMPGNVKWASAEFTEQLERLERESQEQRLPPHVMELINQCSSDEKSIVEIFDRLEFCISMLREASCGNFNGRVYFERSIKRAKDISTRLFEGDTDSAYEELYNNIRALFHNISTYDGRAIAT